MSFTLEELHLLSEKELWFLCYLLNPNDFNELHPDIKKIIPPNKNPRIKCHIYKKNDLVKKIWSQNSSLIHSMIKNFPNKTSDDTGKSILNKMLDLQENHLIKSYAKCTNKPSLNNLKNANKLCNMYTRRESNGCCSKISPLLKLKKAARTVGFFK